MKAAVHPVRSLLPRGVHRAEYLVRGFVVLVAIDSQGNCLRRVPITSTRDEETASAWLEGVLEHYDPAPCARMRTSVDSPA